MQQIYHHDYTYKLVLGGLPDFQGRVPVEEIVNQILAHTGQPIFGSEPIMLGLRRHKVIHKSRECLNFQGSASVILLLVQFLNSQFSRSREEVLPLVDLPSHCPTKDPMANCCLSNTLCLCSLPNSVIYLHSIAGYSMTNLNLLLVTLHESPPPLEILYSYHGRENVDVGANLVSGYPVSATSATIYLPRRLLLTH